MEHEKPPFTPPIPNIEPPSQETIDRLSSLTPKERKEFKKSVAYKKHVLPVLSCKKQLQKDTHRSWWKNNWIALLSLIFAIIAALPVIIQAIDAILKLLGL